MPWCPKCRYEYKEGYTVCADCGVELVEELPEVNENDNEDSGNIIQEFMEETSEDMDAFGEEIAKCDPEYDPTDDVNFDPDRVTPISGGVQIDEPFVKASERAENYKSSAFALLLVGGLGLIFLILSYLDIIHLSLAKNIEVIFYAVMGIMFVIFVVVGIKSLLASKSFEKEAVDEDALTNDIYKYFEENINNTIIDERAFANMTEQLSDEEKYFPRSKAIRETIIEVFGTLRESYINEMTENLYAKIFDK